MSITTEQTVPVTLIKPRAGWQVIDFHELREYRDLFYFLVWRDIKILYAQTVLGFAWAVLNPLLQILVFTLVFGRVAKVDTDGIPYVLFTTVAIVPWAYMSQAMIQSSQSLVQGQQMLDKIYFPRLIFPITPVLARMVDFAISILIVVCVAFYYRVNPTRSLLFLPIFLLLMMCLSAGVGMWLSAMAIRFRDVRFAMQYMIRLLMYSAPIVYSASSISGSLRFWYFLNPLVCVIEGIRSCLLGTEICWNDLLPGFITAILLLISGALYFKRMERVFVDVI